MRLYIVRHAEAYPLGEHGIATDEQRFLTPRGRRQSRRLGRALRVLGVEPGAVWSSNYVRAWETAELLAARLAPPPPVQRCAELRPPVRLPALWQRLVSADCEALLLVGHEPAVGELLTRLITLGTAADEAPLALAKGAVACVTLPTPAREWGEGRLEWLLTSEVLKPLSRRARRRSR